MNNLLNKIHQQNATAFTHSGKFMQMMCFRLRYYYI